MERLKEDITTTSPEGAASGIQQGTETRKPFLQRVGISSFFGETVRQTGMLFSAQVCALGLSSLSGILLWRLLDPSQWGRFWFCQSVIITSGTFFEFGFFSAGARVLALAKSRDEERSITGGMLLMALVIGICYAIFIFLAASPIDYFFSRSDKGILFAAAILAPAYTFQMCIEQCCQGMNQIKRLSIFHPLSAGTCLLIISALAFTGRLTAGNALLAYLAGIGVASIFTIALFNPKLTNSLRFIKLTLKESRVYGLNMYIARITGTASTRIDTLIIGYILGATATINAQLGFYGVAQKLTSPFMMMARGLAITRFRVFSKMRNIPERISKWNGVLLLVFTLGLVIAGPIGLRIFFPKYTGAGPLLGPLALAALFAGLFQPYNMFLAAHGRGGEIRNIAIFVTLASMVSLLIVVPHFGVLGAAICAATTMLADYLLHRYYYGRYLRSSRESDETPGEEQLPPAPILDV